MFHNVETKTALMIHKGSETGQAFAAVFSVGTLPGGGETDSLVLAAVQAVKAMIVSPKSDRNVVSERASTFILILPINTNLENTAFLSKAL